MTYSKVWGENFQEYSTQQNWNKGEIKTVPERKKTKGVYPTRPALQKIIMQFLQIEIK